MGIPASPRPAVADCVRLYVLYSKEREFGSTVVAAGSNTDGEWDTQKIAAKKAIGRSYLEIERYSFALYERCFPPYFTSILQLQEAQYCIHHPWRVFLPRPRTDEIENFSVFFGVTYCLSNGYRRASKVFSFHPF